jgi:hypothetical protein
MLVKLVSKVPTVYQSKSIQAFGLPVQRFDGSFYCDQEYQTKKDAIDYMLKRAEILAEDEKELREMKKCIKKHGVLHWDAATLHIERVNEKD